MMTTDPLDHQAEINEALYARLRRLLSRHWCLFALLLTGLVVRLCFVAGYQGNDDRNYIAYAYAFASEGRTPVDIHTQWIGRIGNWLPMAACMRLLGPSETSAYVFSLLCSLGTVTLVYLIGHLLFDHRTAQLATLLCTFFPLEICYATTAYVDCPVGFFMLLAFYFILLTRKNNLYKYFLFAGMAAGYAYLCRMTAVFLFPPICLYAYYQRWSIRSIFTFVAGFAFMCILEAVFWSCAAANPVHRYVAVSTAQRRDLELQAGKSWFPRPKPTEIYRSDNNLIEPLLMFTTNEEFGLFYYLAAPVIIWSLFQLNKNTSISPLVIWVLLVGALHLYFPVHFPRYTLPRDPRYFTCITGPVLILISHAMLRWPRTLRWSLVSLLFISTIAGLHLSHVSRRYPNERALADWVNANEHDQFWISARLANHVFIYSGFRRPPNMNVHLFSQSSRSHNWESLQHMCPKILSTSDTKRIEHGYLVTYNRTLRLPDIPTHWADARTINQDPPSTTKWFMHVLYKMNMPHEIVDRLLPSGGKVIRVFLVNPQPPPRVPVE